MTITYDITKAERHHKPVAELRRQHVAEVTAEIAYETTMEHAISIHIESIETALIALSGLVHDKKPRALMADELMNIERQYLRMAMLITALWMEKKRHG